jgi:ABC-type nitrate/sulfonate/bicarbonate transport system permease component
MVAAGLLSGLTSSILFSWVTLIYIELRAQKEGLTPEMLAAEAAQ